MAEILPASPDVVHRKRGPHDENNAPSAFMANLIVPHSNATPQFGSTDKKARHYYSHGEDINADTEYAMATKRGRMMLQEEQPSPLSSALVSSSSAAAAAGTVSLSSSSSSITPATVQQGWSSITMANNASFGLGSNSELGYLRSQVASLRAQLEITTQQSQQQVAQLTALNGQVVQGAERIQAEKMRLEEDNRILKKAVAIQDSRQREQAQSNNQLQHLLQQAIAQINVLNQENHQLKARLSPRSVYSQTRDVFPHDPPPDVF
jgi:hypothetical protein